MALVKVLRSRGTTVVVEANAEVLVMPGGDLSKWKNRFSNSITRYAREAAPVNKRPRWGHYGKPLKKTLTSSSQTLGMRMHFAVGSTSNHALFVDQGTKSFDAKILPPWTRGSPSLYEHTWKVPERVGTDYEGRSIIEFNEVGKIRVRGQRAQKFMQTGIDRAFRQARIDAAIELDAFAAKSLAFFPASLTNFVGGTPADAAFIASLTEWRAWRDAAWYRGDVLGLGINKERTRRELRTVRRDIADQMSLDQRREANRIRQARFRDRNRTRLNAEARATRRANRRNRGEDGPDAPNSQRQRAIQNDKLRVLAIAQKRYPDSRYSIRMEFANGRWTAIISLGGYPVGNLASGNTF